METEHITKGEKEFLVETYMGNAQYLINSEGIILCEFNLQSKPERKWLTNIDEQNANAHLFREALILHKQSGLTPSQLLEQRNELLGVLKSLVEETEDFDNNTAFLRRAREIE